MSVDLEDNQITGISPLKGLDRLQQLILNNNKITDLAPISETIALQYIAIENNQVKSLEPLRKLERLSSLYADEQPGHRSFPRSSSCPRSDPST